MRRSFFLILIATTATGATFPRPCSPFPLPHQNEIMQRVTFDDECGRTGSSGSRTPSGAQNRVKNNLCAAGDPALVTMFSFDRLQEATGVIASPPQSRARFEDLRVTTEGDRIGEGTLVRFAAFVLKAKYSNVGSGESVNCVLLDERQNDIHIALVDDPEEEDECTSVTAEMIPHYRPAAWTPEHFHFVSRFTPEPGHQPYTDYDTSKRPVVRVTGQLFYDASHTLLHARAPSLSRTARELGDSPGVRAGRVHQRPPGEPSELRRRGRRGLDTARSLHTALRPNRLLTRPTSMECSRRKVRVHIGNRAQDR